MVTRREFLQRSAIGMAGLTTAPLWLSRATAATNGKRKILIPIFQRGAVDGLNVVIPFAEKRYYELRPTIGIQPPGAPNGSIDLDGRFAFNPALQPLKPLWDNHQLAIIEATGSPDPSRSHFDAQDQMESGTPGKVSRDGWLNRSLDPAGPETSPVRALAIGARLPRTLLGQRAAIAVNGPQGLQGGNAAAAAMLESMYSSSKDASVGSAGKDAFAAMKIIDSVNKTPYAPANGAQYGAGGDLGRSLQQIARLIKADVGVEAAFAEVGGWDHHSNENAQLANLLRQFSAALSAFSQDMGDRMEDIVLVTMSEFGRTPQENGNGGTDHGHGDLMMVIGGSVAGGKVYGQWPGLEVEQLYQNRDLEVTTDYRDVLSELVQDHLGHSNLKDVFPGYAAKQSLGLLKS